MNKRSQYKSTEYMIIIASALFILITVLMFLNDTGITGFATRTPTKITFTPNETITEPTIEEPVEIVSEQKEPEIEIQAGCVTPYEDMVINSNVTLCSGTYNLGDLNYDGSIKIGSSGISVLCNNTVILGNNLTNTIAIKSSNNGIERVKIQNCVIKDYWQGISFSVSRNDIIENNIIENCNYGIYVTGNSNINGGIKIYNNTIHGKNDYGIYLYYHKNVTIENNYIKRQDLGMELNTINNSLIKNNIIVNIITSGIRILERTSYNNTVHNNSINNSNWNCLDIDGYYSVVSNNFVTNCAHNGIDMCGGTRNQEYSGYRNITRNFLINATIYTCLGIYDNIEFNNIDRGFSPDNVGGYYAIAISGNSSEVHHNIVSNNLIKNAYLCIASEATNNIWSKNTLINCIDTEIRVNNWYKDIKQINNDIFINNNYSDGNALYSPNNYGPMNYTVNEYSAEYHKIKLFANKYVTWNYSGYKSFRVDNLTVYFYNLSPPFNDIKDVGNNSILASNTKNFSIIVSENQQIIVGDFVAGTPPENNPPTMDSITLTSNLTCITSASDPDDDELTTIIEFYLNNTLNKTVTATSSTQTNYSGTHYCRARAYDGQEYSEWITSNNVTINATTSAQPLAISDINLASDLNCSATVNQQANISIAFYNNNTINTTYTLQNINGSFSSKISNSSGIWQCIITANNSINTTTATSNTVIIDSINNPPTINVSLSNELNCSTISYDPDNDALTTFIEWYYNDSLNKTITADSDIQTNYSGTHYCRARAYDGQDYSQWATSDTITTTINETDIPPIISYLSLSNSLVCSGTVNELTNMTIIFYHNTEVNATSIQQDIIGSFTASAIESDGEWYCKAIASDGMNTTTASSNTITIETNKKSSSGGRSGGSSQSIPITPSKPEPNITKEETVKNAETKTPQKSINTEPEIIESEEKPIIEIPTIIKSSKYRPLIVCMVIFLILAIAVLFTIKPVETNPKIIEYTTKSLNLGYSYNAIRISLQKYVPDAVIDHHFHMLKMHNKKPIIRIQTPIDKTITDPNAVLAMKQSIAKHRAYGFKDKDIEKMLLSNGYPKSLIEASIKA